MCIDGARMVVMAGMGPQLNGTNTPPLAKFASWPNALRQIGSCLCPPSYHFHIRNSIAEKDI